MSDLPDYSNVSPPPEKAREEYDHHERRAEIFEVLVRKGDPSAVQQRQLAETYDVSESTISRDMDRIRESTSQHLGTEAKLTTRTLGQHVVRELLEADDWRATKAAWDVHEERLETLFDLGAIDREPDRAELDVDMTARQTEVSYTIVREEPELPTDTAGGVDYDDLGFAAAPGEVNVEVAEDLGGDGGE
jgi:transposase